MIRDVHTRVLPVPVEEAGHWLEQITGPGSPIWPEAWPPLILDRGLELGSAGGHGPVRYHVTDHRRGRRVEFQFDEGIGIEGTHAFEIHDGSTPGTSLLRHVAIGTPTTLGSRLQWTLAIRWLHAAAIEDIFDRFATAVGHPPQRPARWSPWVRLLQKFE